MKRHSVMRGEPSPPPVAVLEAQINRFSGFRVDNGIVTVETKREPDTTTAMGFIVTLTEAHCNVLHGNEILNEHAVGTTTQLHPCLCGWAES